ncbi:MAG: LpxL/LpxP family Kdo(2)-lipid IV(A) lauroyl/palmitoleoyl acyltransferase [Pseudomonadota bacterium]
MKTPRHRKAKRRLYEPSVWPTWLLVGLAWIVAHLPLAWIRRLGTGTGRLLYRFARSRRVITETNISRCFPELSRSEVDQRVKDVFQSVSIGALELMVPWLAPRRDLSSRFKLVGLEHLQAAHAQGRGVILVGAHYAAMDVISQPLGELGIVDVMYRFNKNPAWEWLQVRGRQRYFDGVIEREDTRQTLRRLKQGRVIWYAADQDYGRKHSVFAPFFGIQAATIVATARFARLNNSPVLMLRQTRHPDMTWTLAFSPVLEDFPSGDDVADATRMNQLLEADIRLHPEQYLWLHKRFKTRPEDEPPFYTRLTSQT